MSDRKTAKDELALREDVRLLGRLLGDTLCEQEGEAAFNLIEHVRQLAVRFRRAGDAGAKSELQAILNRLDQADIIVVVRAFSLFALLCNLAEDQHHNRCERARQRTNIHWGSHGPYYCRGEALQTSSCETVLWMVFSLR
jgi:phosphoenolpyruvate carboxylase